MEFKRISILVILFILIVAAVSDAMAAAGKDPYTHFFN